MLIIIVSFLGIGLAFLWVRPYLRTWQGRRQLLNILLILTPIAAIGNFAIDRLMDNEPQYFKQGLEQLRANCYVQDKVGDFQSYSYYDNKLKQTAETQAKFQVELQGNDKNLYLTCFMQKSKDTWKLVHIKQDSIRQLP